MQEANLIQITPRFAFENVTPIIPSLANHSLENRTLFNPPVFIDLTPEDWASLTLDIQVDTVMMTCLQFKEETSPKHILSQMVTDKKSMNRLLSIYGEKSLQATWEGFFESRQKRLLTRTFIRKTLLEQTNSSYLTLLNDCLLHLDEEIEITPAAIVETRFHRLATTLNHWINWPRAVIQLYDALEIFKAILNRYQQFFPFQLLQNVFDIGRFLPRMHIHEAALIDHKLTQGSALHHANSNDTFVQAEFEHTYLVHLSEAIYEKQLLDKLFKPVFPINQASKLIYFNGISFKNAKNYYFADLINRTEVESVPEYHVLSFAQKTKLMRKKFFYLGENTDYAIGSLGHSLASVLQRIFYYQITTFANHHYSEKELIDQFRAIEAQWLRKKDYPLNPRFLLALHLAESNNLVLPEDDRLKLQTIFNYLEECWKKILVDPPYFNRTQAVVSILHEQLDMPVTKIHQKRYYVITADNMNLSPTYFGTPVEEFLRLADWIGAVGQFMSYQEKTITPRQALQVAEEAFNQNLITSPWVLKKARDNLYEQRKLVSTQAIAQEAQRIAQNYETETEQHRSWMHGIETWISTIPIIGSLNILREGIEDKSITEIVVGIISLSLDALDLLSGGEEKNPVEFEETLSQTGLSLRERVTVKTVHYSVQKVCLSSQLLFSNAEIQVHDDSFLIKEPIYLPKDYPRLVERILEGEERSWRNYPLIHLADEGRVVPIQSQGSYYREVSWHTGEADPKKHLIFKDIESKKYYASGFLKGGGDELEKLSFIEVKERFTVQTVEKIFRSAHDYLIRDFSKYFFEEFNFQVDKQVVHWTDAPRFYENIYQKSPTFRRLFNDYYQQVSHEAAHQKWTIIVQNEVVPRSDFVTKIIYISSNPEISKHYYVSEENDLVASHPEQVYLHELLHAITGENDPIKSHSLRHRGPIVYLGDKILSEAGYFFQQRIMYRRFSDSSAHKAFEAERLQWDKHRKQARYLALQENDYLDDFIDRIVPISQYQSIFGESLTDRFTISETLAVNKKLTEDFIDLDAIAQPFSHQFKRFFAANQPNEYLAIMEFYQKLYTKSRYFSALFNRWLMHVSDEKVLWKFELDKQSSLTELPQGKKVHCLNDLTRTIYIFDDGTEYLSPKGLTPVDKIRQLTFEMVQLLTGLPEPASDIALRNRGAVVFFTDKILQEAQFIYEKQLVYALATEENPLRQRRLLTYQLEANRAMNLEDRLISSAIREKSGCSLSCRKKRSWLRTFSANSSLFFLDEQSSLPWLKKEIKVDRVRPNLKDHRLSSLPVNMFHHPVNQTLAETSPNTMYLIG